MKTGRLRLLTAALGGSALAIGWYRPWQLSWGASRAEIERMMPGDEVVPCPTFNATRAVTVAAPPHAVWPWIAQIGFGRAGWYSYDLLDNLGHRSADDLIPELQHLEVGDLVPLGPGKDSGMRVKAVDAGRWIVWWDQALQLTSWTWQLTPMSDGTTRLVTRVRSRSTWRHPSTVVWRLLAEVADFPMMRRCLLGIKSRAEARWTRVSPQAGPVVSDVKRTKDREAARALQTAPVASAGTAW
jgi:hypothetical protein